MTNEGLNGVGDQTGGPAVHDFIKAPRADVMDTGIKGTVRINNGNSTSVAPKFQQDDEPLGSSASNMVPRPVQTSTLAAMLNQVQQKQALQVQDLPQALPEGTSW